MTVEEFKLLLTSAQIEHTDEEKINPTQVHWTDWWAAYIKSERPDLPEDEIAMALREADSLYQLETEQSPYILFLAQHVLKELSK